MPAGEPLPGRGASSRPAAPATAYSGVAKKLPLALLVFFSALLYNQIQPPPPKVPGSPGGPPITANRTKLRDGRHLAYLESGVPKDQAKYKIIFVHGFFCCRYDVLNVSQVQGFGIALSMHHTQTNQRVD
uniref:Uncharacterized protein n=1 Tax=Aegilops tauschii subsp. strangulata TaxID=200361 RepID=A0A452Z6K5_AEGTS